MYRAQPSRLSLQWAPMLRRSTTKLHRAMPQELACIYTYRLAKILSVGCTQHNESVLKAYKIISVSEPQPILMRRRGKRGGFRKRIMNYTGCLLFGLY